ncbi:MAG: hypothetical protein ACQPRI_06025 [Solitalea-like symbiont of Tyrophagus putrescentiae]
MHFNVACNVNLLKFFIFNNCFYLVIITIVFVVNNIKCQYSNQSSLPVFQKCPPTEELVAANCICHAKLQYLICDGNSNYFRFQSSYYFKKLIIKNSPKLPFWTERLQKPGQLQVDSLLVLQGSKPKIVENFNELLQIPGLQSLEVVSNGHIELRFTDIPTSIKSISINNVASLLRYPFDGLLDNFNHIETVHLRNVRFNPPLKNGLFIKNLPVKILQLNNVSLSGNFAFVPLSPLPAKVRKYHVTIDLRNNELTYFDFEALFPDDSANNLYHYYINLSGNRKLDKNLFTSQLAVLKSKAAFLSVYLDDVKLTCSDDLQKLVEKHKFIHGINCDNYNGELSKT